MDPLVATVLLAFGLLVAASLTAWMALTLGERMPDDDEAPAAEPETRRPHASNDDVRGARVRPARGRTPAPLRTDGNGTGTVDGNRATAPSTSTTEPDAQAPHPPDRARPTHQDPDDDPFERFLRGRSPRDTRDDFDF